MKILKPGNYFSFLFENEEERRLFVADFAQQGTDRNEKTVFLLETGCDSASPGYNGLSGNDGKTIFHECEDIWSGQGQPTTEGLISFINEQTDRAISEGFAGMRLCFEVNGVLGDMFASAGRYHLGEALKKAFSEKKNLGVFQYDMQKARPDIFLGLLGQSPSIIIGNEVYENMFSRDQQKELHDDAPLSQLKQLAGILKERKALEENLKKGDAALKASEENYRSIFETAANLIAVVDKKGIIVDCNSQIQTVLGYAREEVIGRPFPTLFHPDHLPRAYEAVREVIKKGVSYHKEFVMLHREGSTVYVSVNSTPLKNGMGRISRVISVVEDVTERKRAEAALMESEKRYRQLIEASPDAVLTLADGIVIFANSAALALFSVNHPRDIIGREAADLVSPEDKEVFARCIGTIDSDGGHGDPAEIKIIHTDDSVRYAEWTGTIFMQGAKPMTMLIGHDITARKLAEMRLHESEERYRIAIENSNDGVSIVKGNIFLYVNRRFVELFGYENAKELMKMTISDTVHPDDRDRVMSINAMRQRGELASTKYEFRGLKKNGDTLFIEVSAAPIQYRGEAASLIYLRDVGDRKKTGNGA